MSTQVSASTQLSDRTQLSQRKSRLETWRHRRWLRRRGLEDDLPPEAPPARPDDSGRVRIDSHLDFENCPHPGCPALRPLDADGKCPVCGR